MNIFKNLNTVDVEKLELVFIMYLCVVKGSKKMCKPLVRSNEKSLLGSA